MTENGKRGCFDAGRTLNLGICRLEKAVHASDNLS